MATYKSIWPAPVYVARLSDGETVRMSFHSRAGKPLDFDRGRRIVSGVVGNEQGRAAAMKNEPYAVSDSIMLARYAPAKLAAGHVEWNDVIYPDPHFAPTAVEPANKAKTDSLSRMLAAIGKLSADQRNAVLDALAAAEHATDRRIAA